MRNLFFFILFFFTLNCSINKVSNIHGFRLLEDKSSEIIIAKTNKNDVRRILGPPSSISKFDDTWFYIERKQTNQNIYKLGKKKISVNNVLILEFDKYGVVELKKIIDINNMNEIKIADKKTLKKFEQDNLLYNILATLRDKVNAPTRNKKK